MDNYDIVIPEDNPVLDFQLESIELKNKMLQERLRNCSDILDDLIDDLECYTSKQPNLSIYDPK